ncbi:MAG: penicillin-binding protein 2 [Thermodesulfobacteriota bacterium]
MGERYFQEKEPLQFKKRVYLATILAAILFFVLIVRLWHLQIMKGSFYGLQSRHNKTRTVKSQAPRGIIYDRNGIKLVINRPGFDLYIIPEDVTDWPGTKSMLNKLTGLTEDTINKRLKRASGRPPFRAVKLKEDLSWEETVKIESFNFEMNGVMLDVTPKREYIYGRALSHLIGYLGELNIEELKRLHSKGYDAGDYLGKYGLEKSIEEHLRGTDGFKDLEVDALGRKINVLGWTPPFPGHEVTLTIDIKTQLAAWQAMGSNAGAVVALEPKTGRILAMLSSPSFDPNKISAGITHKDWNNLLKNPLHPLTNKVIQGQYPPASTFKPLVAASGLADKAIKPETLIESGPAFHFAGRSYRDWKAEGHGIINYKRAIIESSDTFFYQLGLLLGVNTLAKHSRSFGLGSPTGIRLDGEKSGLVPDSEWKKRVKKERWYQGETISVAVGQGFMLATPIQMASAFAAIANGGTLYRPAVIEQVTTPEGKVLQDFKPEISGRVDISAGILKKIRMALRAVVTDKDGTARLLSSNRLKIAGKTGTAQVAHMIERERDLEKIQYKLRDHAWFVGFAPYDDPQIVIAVLVEHGGFGASSAAPIAKKIFKAYLTNRTGLHRAPAAPPSAVAPDKKSDKLIPRGRP